MNSPPGPANCPSQDGWPASPPPDEFSLNHPVNRLVRLDKKSAKFAEVEQLFAGGWLHSKKRPNVRRVFKILWPEPALQPYLDYRDQVQNTLQAKDSRGNEKLLFHGTNRACLLAESSANVVLCGLADCSLCSILRTSFDVSKCGAKNSFTRFGHGIYTTACSSKADDYVRNLSDSAFLRVMILSRVVVGNSYKQYQTAPTLTAPPSGYDSISGETGQDLNYEETVTYENDTVRPAYLIAYGDKPKRLRLKTFVQLMFKTPIVS